MPRKGKKFENEYAWLHEINKDYNVISPAYLTDKITGEKREIDVLIQYKDDEGNLRSIGIECRDRNNKENVMWIEQLVTKKNDLGLDFMIATTTKDFSKTAIEKALHYGVIIEKAEMLDSKLIEEKTKEFICDVFYLIVKVKECSFLLNNGNIIDLKSMLKNLSLIEKSMLLRKLDEILLLDFDFAAMLEQTELKLENFFEPQKEAFAELNRTLYGTDNRGDILEKLKINAISYKLELQPHRISLPLNKSLSVFFVKEKENKKYRALFGSEEENITIGYLSDNNIDVTVNLKQRKYCRIIGGNTQINTIFPKDREINLNINDFDSTIISPLNYNEII